MRHLQRVRINAFALEFFHVLSWLMMHKQTFTLPELMEVFSQGTAYSFLNRGLKVGAIERIDKGRFRLSFIPDEIRINRRIGEEDGERIMIKNGLVLVVE